jgi:F-box/leucine-rich repeat protein 10/11
VSPALAEEDLQVEEIKRMAAKEEFGLRIRRSY